MVKYIILTFLFLLKTAYAFDVSVYLDKTNYSLGEQVKLHIEVQNAKKYQIDLSQIERKFKVVAKRRISSTNIINGQFQSSETTILTFDINEAGNYTIPPITTSANGSRVTSEEILFEVSSNNALKNKYSDLFSANYKLKANGEKIYVSENMILTIILSNKSNNIGNEAYIPPASDDFIIQRLGETKSYTKIIDGAKANFVKIHYLLIPLRSGKLEIDLGRYELDIIDYTYSNDPMSGFFTFSTPNTVKKLSFPVTEEPLILEVSNTPNNEALNILEELVITTEANKNEVTISEPIEYIISIKANDIKVENLEEITLEDNRFKIYAEDEVSSNEFNPETLSYIATKTRKFILIPQESGTIELPQYSYSWLNKKTGKKTTTTTKTKTVIVNNKIGSNQSELPKLPEIEMKNNTNNNTNFPKHYLALLIIISIIATLQFIYIIYLHYRRNNETPISNKTNKNVIADIEEANIANNYSSFSKQILTNINKSHNISAASIGELITILKTINQKQYQLLITMLETAEQANFAKNKQDFNYVESYKKISKELKKIKKQKESSKAKFNLNP